MPVEAIVSLIRAPSALGSGAGSSSPSERAGSATLAHFFTSPRLISISRTLLLSISTVTTLPVNPPPKNPARFFRSSFNASPMLRAKIPFAPLTSASFVATIVPPSWAWVVVEELAVWSRLVFPPCSRYQRPPSPVSLSVPLPTHGTQWRHLPPVHQTGAPYR